MIMLGDRDSLGVENLGHSPHLRVRGHEVMIYLLLTSNAAPRPGYVIEVHSAQMRMYVYDVPNAEASVRWVL